MTPPFGRLLTAMVTPFKEDLSVDSDRAIELAKRLIEQGNDGLIVSGTTGESPTLTKPEKLALFKSIKAALPNNSIVAGTGSYDTKASIELSKAAADCGVDGLLLVTPYYNKPAQSMILRHFLEIAEATELPIMLYNIPSRCGVEIAPETLAKLAQHPRIVAVKQSLPDVDQIIDLQSRVKADGSTFWQYSGDDTHTLSIMAAGGCGVVSVAAHVVAKEMKEMIELFLTGKVLEAADIQTRIFNITKGLFATTNPVLPKAALKLQGFPVGGLRPPVYEATEEDIAKLKPLLAELGLL